MSHNSMLPDKNSFLRRSIMSKYLANPMDTLDFYDFVSSLHWVPLLGNPLLRMILNHYGYRFHSGAASTLPETQAIFDRATEISVSECACRVRLNNCDTSTRTCIKVNTAARVQKRHGTLFSETITADEAKAIVEKSFNDGLILTVEWCVAPYIYTICSCCSCCCLPRKLRFERNIPGALFPSEYLPAQNPDVCTSCEECLKVCPADALVFQRKALKVSEKKCIGCGHCERVCMAGSIRMKKSRPSMTPPVAGPVMAAFVNAASYLILFPMAYGFVFFKGRRRRKRPFDWASDDFHEHEHEHAHEEVAAKD